MARVMECNIEALLAMFASVEAIFLSIFVLIIQTAMQAQADRGPT
jgi:hypothetical protein